MPTEKPRITFTVNPETLSKIDDYRYSHNMKNQTQAILSLLERGLSSLSQSASTVKAETAIPEDDGSAKSKLLRIVSNTDEAQAEAMLKMMEAALVLQQHQQDK